MRQQLQTGSLRQSVKYEVKDDMAKSITSAYQKVQANTASPGQRVIMVYKGISKSISEAIDESESDDPDRFFRINDKIQFAQKLIMELQMALDMERGGEIAANLNKLYTFWRRYLTEANVAKDKQKLQHVLDMVLDLTESWIAAEKSLKGQ